MGKFGLLFCGCLLVCSAKIVSAATERCVIVSVEKQRLTVECGERTKNFQSGEKIKIKTVSGRKAE